MTATSPNFVRLDFEPGDLLFFWGRTFESRFIEWLTRGPSHVGIITRWSTDHRFNAANLLVESTTLCDLPDLELHRRIDGVQVHDPLERVRNYDGRVSRLRLHAGRELNCTEQSDLTYWLRELHGEPYDLRSALTSGTRLFKWLPFAPYPDLGHLFCSELCAEMLMRLNRLPLWDPCVYNPASLMRTLLRCASYDPPVILK